MPNAAQIVAAFRDVGSTKSLCPEEMNDLIKDGILAGLARIHGPNVQAEIAINEDTGEFEAINTTAGTAGLLPSVTTTITDNDVPPTIRIDDPHRRSTPKLSNERWHAKTS